MANLEGYRTIISGAIAAAAGAASILTRNAFHLDMNAQAQLVNDAIALVTIFAGGGSIVFRILANIPALVQIVNDVTHLKAQMTMVAPRVVAPMPAAQPGQPPAQ